MDFDLIAHVTHEAGHKIGGIGAVLTGLLSSAAYQDHVRRSVLVGALDPGSQDRVFDPRNHFELLYASGQGIAQVRPAIAQALHAVEVHYGVAVLYGRRTFGEHQHEVLLVDVGSMDPAQVAQVKYELWQHARLPSGPYEHDAEFERYVRLAGPGYAALWALTEDAGPRRVLVAHEWMGVPLGLLARHKDPALWRTAYYAHEVPSARLLVEEHPGHDVRFYNALGTGLAQGLVMDVVFGDQHHYFKHAVVERAASFDAILAVGDPVVDELRFMGGGFAFRPIDLVYNGIPCPEVTLADKAQSRALLQEYAYRLLGYRPDHVLTHVTRFVLSKAIWRDLRVLVHLDWLLARAGRTAVLFVLSSHYPAGRPVQSILRWEAQYGWPVAHRSDNGDLAGHETSFFFDGVEPFNRASRAVKVVLVNQYGWDARSCGTRMPALMSFGDLRRGTDVEFGQSIYEPFGIAQVEPLSAGAISAVSDVCGCVGFVRRVGHHEAGLPNLVVGEFTRPPHDWHFASPWDALRIDRFGRDLIEAARSWDVAQAIHARLPTTDAAQAALLESGQVVASQMSWEKVVESLLLPALRRVGGLEPG